MQNVNRNVDCPEVHVLFFCKTQNDLSVRPGFPSIIFIQVILLLHVLVHLRLLVTYENKSS